MSLIQEALKRKTEEQGDNRPPEPPALPKQKKSSPAIKTIVSVILFVTVMVALAIFGYSLIKSSTTGNSLSGTTKDLLKLPKISAPLNLVERQKLLKNKTEDSSPETTEPSSPRLFKKQTAPTKNVHWPEINLSGFGTAPDGRLAIINGKVMREGQSINGATIVKILPHKVIMEYQGDTRSLSSGEE